MLVVFIPNVHILDHLHADFCDFLAIVHILDHLLAILFLKFSYSFKVLRMFGMFGPGGAERGLVLWGPAAGRQVERGVAPVVPQLVDLRSRGS